MHASFHTVGLPRLDIKDVISLVGKSGYTAIELNAETLPWAQPHITPQTPRADRAEIRRSIDQAGLKVSAIGAHIPLLNSNGEDRRSAMDFVKGCTEIAVDMGTDYIHILSGQLEQGVSSRQGWKWFLEALAEIVDHAGAHDVKVGIEAIAGHMFHGADDFARAIADLPGTPFKVNFDPSQIIIQENEPLEILDRFGDRIMHVHMKDGKGLFPDFSFPPLGQGSIDFDRLVHRLEDIGYKGALSVEYESQVFGFHLSDEEILRSGREFLSRLGT